MLRSHARRAVMLSCALALFITATPVAAASAATSTTQAAGSGSVTATFTFTYTPPITYPTKHLTISRAGQVVYDQAVSSSLCGTSAAAQKYCGPGGGATGKSSVHVVDLEPGGEPAVVLDLYTEGAHCCFIEQVYSFNPATGTYDVAARDFRDPGAQIKDLGHDGRFEFLTADPRFAYAFTDFADSGLPIQILTFSGGHFTDVTRSYPKLIAKDAAVWLKAFKHDLTNGVGLIAAWAADEDMLGHTRLVSQTLNKELRAGHLRSLAAPTRGRRFIKALDKLLKKDGYVH